jgi:hypothetical protein
MNPKLVILTLLVASGAGAYFHVTGQRAPLQRLLERPISPPEQGYGGILELGLGEDITQCRDIGRITVFVFTAHGSSACHKLQNLIGQFIPIRPDVAFRFVDITDLQGLEGDWRGFLGVDIGSLPHVMIYDARGQLIAGDQRKGRDGLRLLYEWISQEHQRYGSAAAASG